MKLKSLTLALLAISILINNIAFAENEFGEILYPVGEYKEQARGSDDQNILAKVRQVYLNYKKVHPNCGYQPNPVISFYPQQIYTLVNPYIHGAKEINAINFKIRNFVITSPVIDKTDPYCGKLTVKCASYVRYMSSSNYYCERIHKEKRSEPSLLSDPRYNNYIAYQTIYNQSVMPRALKNFGLLKQFFNLDAFPPFSTFQTPNPNYEYDAVSFTTFIYPDPTDPLSPNYNNGNYGFLFLSSAENLKSICKTIQNQNLSRSDAAVRFNQFLGLPPDSPDVVRSFIFFKLRNNPHVSGKKDGNMFRPCPIDGHIETTTCSGSALMIPHDCSVAPLPYDGTTVSSFNANYFYSVYCNTTPNINSGMPVLYPWTGQGFTYDWYPWNISLINVQGTSEYVPAENSGTYNIEVAKKISLENFLLTCDYS